MKITITLPDHSDLPPTREEKFKALLEKAEELMEMADVGHNEDYCIKCLKIIHKKLKGIQPAKDYAQRLEKRIASFLLQHTGELPK